MAYIRLKNLSKKFGEVSAVKDVKLEIKDREFCVLVGPSGCGKSTTLRMVAGLEYATEGEIWIDDILVNDIPPKDRDIAMVFQNYALYPHMTSFNNMALGLKLRKYSKEEISKRVNDAADILAMKKFLGRLPKELSGGQRQRVAVGRAIVRKPKVFLFDEPLSNLDAKLRVQMRAELKKLHSRLQATIIYVTHDQVEAMTLGDKIIVMHEGKIQQTGDPLTVYDHPANKFVAGFIGSPPMNFLKAEVMMKDSGLWLDDGKFEIKPPDEIYGTALKKYIGKEVILGIRPEHIYDKLYSSMGTTENTLAATVDVVELLGNEKVLHLTNGNNNFHCVVNAHNQVEENQDIDVVFNMERIHIFDKETEEKLI